MLFILDILLLIVQFGLFYLVAYLVLLTVAALSESRQSILKNAPPTYQFLFLIPAHNEQKLLPNLLASIAHQDYPHNLYQVHIVADNCTDDTAGIGRGLGAIVHERVNQEERGKGYALQWLLKRIWDQIVPHDAVVFLDADSEISPDFLKVMNARLTQGERVIQAYYTVKDTTSSPAVALRWAALAVLHYLRPLGRMKLGGSAGLKGNGMVFTAEVIRKHEWSSAVTEDIELHMELLLGGERVTFAPEAVVRAEMPETLARSRTQNVRWEQGRMEMSRRYVPALVAAGFRQSNPGRSFPFFDAVMEHVIPPFSILASLSLITLFVGMARAVFVKTHPPNTSLFSKGNTFNRISLGMAVLTIAGQVVYLLVGLRLTNAPKAVYRSLLLIPIYIFWKVWHYIRILLNLERQEWVRTIRNRE